jgi:hypothetical protein
MAEVEAIVIENNVTELCAGQGQDREVDFFRRADGSAGLIPVSLDWEPLANMGLVPDLQLR